MKKYKPDLKRTTFDKKDIKTIIDQAMRDAEEDWGGIAWEGDAAIHGLYYLKESLYKLFLLKKV